MRSEHAGTVVIPLSNGSSFRLQEVLYTPECDSNLISLGQLRESGIIFYDTPNAMILKEEERPLQKQEEIETSLS